MANNYISCINILSISFLFYHFLKFLLSDSLYSKLNHRILCLLFNLMWSWSSILFKCAIINVLENKNILNSFEIRGYT